MAVVRQVHILPHGRGIGVVCIENTIYPLICNRHFYPLPPTGKNPSIAPDASSDPLCRNFRTTAIAPKLFMPPQHQYGKFPSTMQNALQCWCAELFSNQKYFVDLSLAGWIIFLTDKLCWINFSDDFVEVFDNFCHFVHLFDLFDHSGYLYGPVVPVCTQWAAKFPLQPSICAESLLKFSAQLSICAKHTLKILTQRQICAKMLMKLCILSSQAPPHPKTWASQKSP